MDGQSYCGSRSYAIDPIESWMKISNETLTIESLGLQDTPINETFKVSVTLDNGSSISDEVEFNAELVC